MTRRTLAVPSIGAIALAIVTSSCRVPDEPVAITDRVAGTEARALVTGQPLLIGGKNGQANAVNDRGEVVGVNCAQTCFTRAFYWTETGGVEDLGTLPGYTRSVAYAITDNGAVFGMLECYSGDAGCGGQYSGTPARWDRVGGTWTITPLQGCAYFNPWDLPVNNNEQCVGQLGSQLVVQTLSGGAVLSSEPLPKLNPGDFERAYAISDVPMVTGSAGSAPAVWYRDLAGGWRLLILDPLGHSNTGAALDISEPDAAGRVRVSGRALVAGNYRAARWTLDPDGQGGWRVSSAQVLENLRANRNNDAWGHAINTAGDVAGHSNFLPVLWPNGGAVQSLPLPSGKADGKALDLNDHGIVVGYAWDQASACNRAAVWRLP